MGAQLTLDPNLPSSCARAATAAEARYRIDRPITPARAPRIVALDDGAAPVVGRAATLPWANARFYGCEPTGDGTDGILLWGIDGDSPDAGGVGRGGVGRGAATLADELASADVVVMIATGDRGADRAYAIGKACWQRGVMTAGLVVGDGAAADAAVAALRPHARVLVPDADESDVAELLTALRA